MRSHSNTRFFLNIRKEDSKLGWMKEKVISQIVDRLFSFRF